MDYATHDAVFPCSICGKDGFYTELIGGYKIMMCLDHMNEWWEYCDNSGSFKDRVRYLYLQGQEETEESIQEALEIRRKLFLLCKEWVQSNKMLYQEG